MFALARMLLRGRKAGLAGSFVALLGASALLTAFGVLLQSGLGPGEPPRRYAAADVVVSGRQSFTVREAGKSRTKSLARPAELPRRLAGGIARVPGVRTAVADVTFPAAVVDAAGRPLTGVDGRPSAGHGWDSAALGPYALVAGRAPHRSGEVALDAALARRAGVAPGQRVRLVTTEAVAAYRVTGLAALRGDRTAPVLFTESDAARLSGDPERIGAVGVLAAPGTDPDVLADRIEERLGRYGVLARTGADRGRTEDPRAAADRAGLRELAASLGSTVLLVTLVVVAGTLSLAVHQRRRELALLRAVAATPRQVARLLAAEVLVVSLAAAGAGCPPGLLLARVLRAALAATGRLPGDFPLSYGPVPALVAVAACVLAAQAATLGVARRAAAVHPVEALFSAAAGRPRLGAARRLFGAALLLLGAAAAALPLFFRSVFAVAGAAMGGLLAVIAVLLLAPPVVAGAARLLAVPVRALSGPSGRLAAANVVARARTLAAGVGPLVLAVGFAVVQLFLPTVSAEAAREQAGRGVVAGFVLSGAAGGLPPAVRKEAAAIPGVRAATGVVRVELHASHRMLGSPDVLAYRAQGVTADGLGRTMDLGVTGGSLARLRDGTVALGAGAAGTLGAGVGGRVRLHLPDGAEIRPVVVAVYERGLGFGEVTLPWRTVVAHSDRRTDDSVLVAAAPGADVGAPLRALAARHPGLRVLDGTSFAAAQGDGGAGGLLDSAFPLVLVFGYLAVAVANSLVLETLGRERELALLRLAGATSRQVMRMVWAEAGMVVLIAVVLGVLVPLPALVTVSLGLTGSPVPWVPPGLLAGVVGAAGAVGVGAVVVPGWWVVRGLFRR
ncbi:ABC transporter permease [Streptomyces luteireticuli]|uniref:ABC transporter permease n=1 Tax=Streptomyces luteireticuli TaxID=173858 RepID=A0ABN0YMU3_9ACTN